MQSGETLTSPINLAEATLGDIAVKLPGATAIFRAADLDYCCRGQVTLKDAAAAASLDLEKIIADLANLRRGARGKCASEPSPRSSGSGVHSSTNTRRTDDTHAEGRADAFPTDAQRRPLES